MGIWCHGLADSPSVLTIISGARKLSLILGTTMRLEPSHTSRARCLHWSRTQQHISKFVQLSTTQLSATQLSATQLSATQLSATQLSATQLSATQPSATQLIATQLSDTFSNPVTVPKHCAPFCVTVSGYRFPFNSSPLNFLSSEVSIFYLTS